VIALSQLFRAAPPGRTVAFGREGVRDADALRDDVAALAALLEPFAEGRLLLHSEDAYAFAVGLLAAAQVGARVVLPPSRQPGALEALASEVTGVLLDSTPTSDTFLGRPCWHPLAAPRARRPLVALDRESPLVELFTSGTTGAGKPVAKAVRHLEDEVAVLEECFGALLGGGTRILATSSPQHLYGLLFRIVWPLSAGRPLLRSPLLHAEELAPHLGVESPFALVSTPIALRHLAEKEELAPFAPWCRAVFSSGGPLPAPIARRVAEALGAAPFEVYGATETGGVALRQQQRGGEPWRPLPRVEVARDAESGCLVVASPFASTGEALPGGRARCTLGDLVAFDEGGFRLLGRADRVVKIGEKRLSLPAMEERLATHPAVADAALVALDTGGDARVGAVVVPTEIGREQVVASGRRGLARSLSAHLAPDFDRVLLPRAWRLVDALPRDAQGKLPNERLLAFFAETSPAPRAPEPIAVRRGARELEARLRIPEDLAFLEGHFPGHPIVAGVVQLHFAMRALEELLGAAPRLAALEVLKFHELLLPGQEVRLRVELDAGGERFAFSLADAGRPERVFATARGALRRNP